MSQTRKIARVPIKNWLRELQTPRCEHLKCAPIYDDSAFEGLDSWEIRKHFPRFEGQCPDCGERVICYSSSRHYIMGDY